MSTGGERKSARNARLAVFVRLSSRPIPRVQRMMQVARELGLQPLFLGAYRERDLPKEDSWESWEIERIGPYFPLLNGKRFLRYVGSVLAYGWALFHSLRKMRPALVHVSDFELFPAARLYATLTGTPLIYNIHDNLSQRYRAPRLAAVLLNQMEGVAARWSSITLVPEAFRRDALPRWARGNVRVVRNTPVDPGFSAPRVASDETPTVLFFAGWLDDGRGLRKLCELVRANEHLVLRVAGDGDAELVSALSSARNVEFLGYLSHREIMSKTAECDFVTALYDPRRPINRFAASNKIAEALAVGRPLLINKELKICELLEPYDCSLVVAYDDTSSVGQNLGKLHADRKRYRAMCSRARRAYEEHYSWDIVREASRAAFRAAGVAAEDDRAPEHGMA